MVDSVAGVNLVILLLVIQVKLAMIDSESFVSKYL